jgi:hypothetical protein
LIVHTYVVNYVIQLVVKNNPRYPCLKYIFITTNLFLFIYFFIIFSYIGIYWFCKIRFNYLRFFALTFRFWDTLLKLRIWIWLIYELVWLVRLITLILLDNLLKGHTVFIIRLDDLGLLFEFVNIVLRVVVKLMRSLIIIVLD